MKNILVLLVVLIIFNGKIIAKVIDGIALRVDGNIITLYEIQEAQDKFKLNKKDALDLLILNKLKENEIKRLNIKVSDSDVDNEINNIILSNKITKDILKNSLKSRGVEFEDYKKELKEIILDRELIRKILQSNTNIASESELKKFYTQNEDKFSIPLKIKVTTYISNNELDLQKVLINPLIINKNVSKRDEDVDVSELPPQIINVFLNTKIQSFTPVLNSGGAFVLFYVREKIGNKVLPFEDAKSSVLQQYAQAKQEVILNEYFNKIKASAKIENIRE